MSLEQEAKKRAAVWTREPYNNDTQADARELITRGGNELIDAFYKDLDFGTGDCAALWVPAPTGLTATPSVWPPRAWLTT
ncbi:MAG: hypothetical protein U5L96_21730 [Owenweeksia sp.]|nr:hypothetical protein [Owenweeksia sp.]